LGILGITVIGAFLVYRGVFKPRTAQLIVFHWIPGPTPLKVLGTPPFAGQVRADMETHVDSRLMTLLRETGIGGELRVVGMIISGRSGELGDGAILLRTAPVAPFAVSLVDSEAAIYIDQMPGFAAFPKTAPPTGSAVTFSPGKNAQGSLLHLTITNSIGARPWGAMGLWWW